MEKEVFIKIMDSIEKNYRLYIKKTDHLSKALNGSIDFVGGEFMQDTVRVLQQIFPPYVDSDGTVHCTIEYYMYELDFGKKKDLNIIHKENGEEKIINLHNSADLYDYLVKYGI